jgi:hypothetical protein
MVAVATSQLLVDPSLLYAASIPATTTPIFHEGSTDDQQEQHLRALAVKKM